MDMYQLTFLKISSTIPGNYHRPVLSKSPSTRHAAAALINPNNSASPPDTDDGIGINNHNHVASSSSNIPSSIPLPPPAASSSSSSSAAAVYPSSSPSSSSATPVSEAPSGRVRSKRARHSKVVIDSSSGVPTATLAVFEFPNNTSSNNSSNNAASSAASANKSATPVGSPPAAELTMDAELLPVDDRRAEEQENGSSSDSSSSSSDEDDANGLEKRLSSEHRSGKKRKQPSSTSSAGPQPAVVRALNMSSAAAMDTSSSSSAAHTKDFGNGSHDAIVPLAIQPLVLDTPFSPDNSQPLPALPSEEKLYQAYGRRPVYGNQCLLLFQGRMSDGSVFTKNRDIFFNSNAAATPTAASLSVSTMKWIKELNGATPLHFTLGIGEVLVAWDACVATMFKGERATIITRDENRQVFIYELQLVDFE